MAKETKKPHVANDGKDASAMDDGSARKTGDIRETVDIAYPPPAEMPSEALEGALMVVKAKHDRGRRRAGFGFSRQETEIPLTDLDQTKRDALASDPELMVSLRLVKPQQR